MDQRLTEQRLVERRLLEQADAARPGADNLRDPALAGSAQRVHPGLHELNAAVARGDQRALDILARIEAADAAISAALDDVPVPEDLAERLLMALKAAEHGEAVDAIALRRKTPGEATVVSAVAGAIVAQVTETATSNSHVVASAVAGTVVAQPAAARVQPAPHAKRVSRRSWLGWSAALTTVAAAVALFCMLYPWAPPWVEPQDVAQDIASIYDSDQGLFDPEAWTPGSPVGLPPVLMEVIPRQPQRWREFKVGRYPATAYDLTSPGAAHRATLVVIDRRVRGLDYGIPPKTPQFSTQGRHVGIWRSETQVFALIVEGDVGDYQQLVEPLAYA
jgi:hypothetical protein